MGICIGGGLFFYGKIIGLRANIFYGIGFLFSKKQLNYSVSFKTKKA